MTDLQRIIDKINYVKSQNYITQAESQELKDRAKNKANAKGNLTDDEKRILNKRLDDALNKKGQADKKQGGLDVPKSGEGLTRLPGQGGLTRLPEKDGKPSPGGKAPTDLEKFIDRVNASENLSKDDKEKLKKEARQRANNSGAFGAADRKVLNDLFTKLSKKKGDGGTQPPKAKDSDNDGIPDSKDTDDDNDGISDDQDLDQDGDGVDDEEEYDDTPASGGPEPTIKGGGKKIDIPKPANRANYNLPKDAERLGMPNIDRKIKAEVEKLTLEIINITKEFIEGGVDYSGIDYVAQNEIIGEDGQPYYPLPDYNAPAESESGLAEERAQVIKELIDELLSKGEKNSSNYNYADYLDLFELRYNGAGEPFFRFSIELTGDIIDDMTVYLAEDYNDIT